MDVDGSDGEYRLSCELRGHESDVRGISVCGSAGIATSSRDCTIKFWVQDLDRKHAYVLSKTLLGHSSFVGPLAWVPPSERFPQGGIVSGGRDTLILLWDLQTEQVVETMKEHDYQVTCLALDENGDIISSSLDRTVRRWRKSQAVESWEAHSVAVQAVLKLPTGELITGSGDSTMKLWKGRTCLHTFQGHTDTVRGLALMPGVGILSASHDSTIKLWTLTGQVLLEMIGHTSLVYSVAANSSGLVASGSEDCSLKIWRDGTCIQTIEHPGCVWDVKFLENGDIASACSDGVLRIWSSQSDRYAAPQELDAFENLLNQYKVGRKTVGGLKLMDLPSLEALEVPGTTDGQTIVIREGDNGVAYSWNAKEFHWDQIGEVVDGPGNSSDGKVFDGVHYDYVFDVDIGDGEPIRKLPYNRSENPYAVADKWLLKENLPLSYRQQVVEFILQNTGQSNFIPNSSYRDPYTGANAYVPGQPSVSNVDPTPKQKLKHIPKKDMLFFEAAQFDGILKKISEFNAVLTADVEKKNLALQESEISRFAAILNVLKETTKYHVSTFTDADIVLLLRLLKSWPPQMIFPVIDVLRMLVLHPEGASSLMTHVNSGHDELMEAFHRATTNSALLPNVLTIIRALTNLFRHSCFHQWLGLNCSTILDVLCSCRSTFNKNTHVAYATLLLNYAVLSIKQKEEAAQSHILSASLEIAEDDSQDSDSIYRALVAIGSLILDGQVKAIAIDLDIRTIARNATSSKEPKISEVASEIEASTKDS